MSRWCWPADAPAGVKKLYYWQFPSSAAFPMTDTTAASTLSAAAAATPADDLPRVAVAPLVYLKLLAVAMLWGD